MALLVLACILGWPGLGAPAPSAPPAERVIRVLQQGTHTPTLVAQLQTAVTRLLEGSGLQLLFVDCHRGRPCQGALSGHELMLRVVPGRDRTSPHVCGMAHLDDGRGSGVLMTVFRGCASEIADALRWMAAHQRASVALLKMTDVDVLAPIVVHEVIHLVLPGEPHGAGLWKAVLDKSDMEDAAHGALRVDAATAARVRAAIAARDVTRPGSR